MLVNHSKAGKTIEKKLKIRIVYAVLLIILGAAAVYIGNFVPLASGNEEFSSGFYNGAGFGLMAASLITIIKNVRILKNEELLRKQEINEYDERNRMIGLKCWSYAGYAMFVVLYIALIIAGAINVVVMQTLLVTLGVFGLCLLISKIVLSKIM